MRAHGKQAVGTGQYRSCVFVPSTSKGKEEGSAAAAAAAIADEEIVAAAREAAEKCRSRLGKNLGTEVRTLDGVRFRFWRAEDRHQRRNEKVSSISGKGGGGNWGRGAEAEDLRSTLSVEDWVRRYGRRRELVLGLAETSDKVSQSSHASYVPASEWDPGDDGMAMMMI